VRRRPIGARASAPRAAPRPRRPGPGHAACAPRCLEGRASARVAFSPCATPSLARAARRRPARRVSPSLFQDAADSAYKKSTRLYSCAHRSATTPLSRAPLRRPPGEPPLAKPLVTSRQCQPSPLGSSPRSPGATRAALYPRPSHRHAGIAEQQPLSAGHRRAPPPAASPLEFRTQSNPR
jgi:hypothetical protein